MRGCVQTGTRAGMAAGMRACMRAGLIGGLVLAGCAGEAPVGPGYKPKPPAGLGGPAAASRASLSGLVYVADNPVIAAGSAFPEGYQLLAGSEGRVTVRIPGNPDTTRAVAIVNGAYVMPDLPMGVDLDVVAVAPGYTARKQVVRIVLPAGRKLNFAYDPDGGGTYLQPFRDTAQQ